MFLSLLKRAVKAALHDGVEEWALESGLPRKLVEEIRAQRLAIIEQADARAALALGVDEDEKGPPALPMPSAARITIDDAGDGEACPPPGDEPALLNWVHRQRERQVCWADIIKAVEGAGHLFNTDALRMRYRRWREKTDSSNSQPPPAA